MTVEDILDSLSKKSSDEEGDSKPEVETNIPIIFRMALEGDEKAIIVANRITGALMAAEMSRGLCGSYAMVLAHRFLMQHELPKTPTFDNGLSDDSNLHRLAAIETIVFANSYASSLANLGDIETIQDLFDVPYMEESFKALDRIGAGRELIRYSADASIKHLVAILGPDLAEKYSDFRIEQQKNGRASNEN